MDLSSEGCVEGDAITKNDGTMVSLTIHIVMRTSNDALENTTTTG